MQMLHQPAPRPDPVARHGPGSHAQQFRCFLFGQSHEATATEYGSKLVAAKGNEAETARLRQESRDFLSADFARRVNEILTPEQRTAFERAAAEERQRAAASKDRKGQTR